MFHPAVRLVVAKLADPKAQSSPDARAAASLCSDSKEFRIASVVMRVLPDRLGGSGIPGAAGIRGCAGVVKIFGTEIAAWGTSV